jgi:RNA polymerase sigma factor (sigma-70 family)
MEHRKKADAEFFEADAWKVICLKALGICKRYGKVQHFEDFSQWLALKYLEGKSLHQPVEYSFIDYCRKTKIGWNSRTVSSEGNFTHTPIMDTHSEDIATKISQIQLQGKRELREELLVGLDLKHRVIIKLYYQWQLSYKEIADILNMTESRTSQVSMIGLGKIFRNLKIYGEVN